MSLDPSPGFKKSAAELGQTTVEYVLILSISVTFAVMLLRGFVYPAFTKLTDGVRKQIENDLFRNVHQFRIRR